MKNYFFLLLLLWLLGMNVVSAAIPKADLSIILLNTTEWPAQYQVSLRLPKTMPIWRAVMLTVIFRSRLIRKQNWPLVA